MLDAARIRETYRARATGHRIFSLDRKANKKQKQSWRITCSVLIQRDRGVLINDTKPLGIDPELESDLLERELESGVIVEQASFVHEDYVVRILGGLITAEEHVLARVRPLRDE